MYYIKCPKCSELVGLKSEYMVLCPHCNKKLSNSFREWKIKNPNATFAQYQSEMCVSSAAITGLGDQRKIGRRIAILSNFRHAGLALTVGIVAIVLTICGIYLYNESQKGASINAIMDDAWKIGYYDDLDVTVKFPFTLEKQNATIDSVVTADSTQTIVGYVTRTWSRPLVAAINAARIEFAPAYGVNREAATQQILQSIVNGNQMQAFEFVPSDYSMGQGVKARMFSGSYLIGIEAYQFRALMVIKGDTVWYFMVAYLRSMPEGTLLAEKFFKGILL